MLPQLTLEPGSEEKHTETERMWVRRAALQSMIEGTALQHVERALKSRTSGDQDYEPGQLVDYYRKPPSKDTS